jgi:hypothetical protein
VADTLAQIFLAEVSRALPKGFRLELGSEWLEIIGPDGGAGMPAYWLRADVLLEEEVVGGASGTLSVVQQEVAEQTTEPWPARSGTQYQGFPEPDAELVGNQLWAWYGRRSNPVLKFGPFDLSNVLLRDE